ncbi:MAG: hypothetical protein Q9157_004787 [Trypethelium eluteriae]
MNLILLRVLSLVFSPDVASFCAFAAVALVIDFSFHLTFFLAVLSVDVKRMELKDSLDRANRTQPRTRSSPVSNWQVWKYFLSSRPLPASTRIVGSAAIVGCVSILNWHFFDWESQKRTLQQVAGLVPQERSATTGHSHMSVPHSFGQTRTPAAWLRMQEYHTAKEVISVVKPDSHSFLARVYDPLMIVLAGADRTGAAAQRQNWLQKTENLIDDHLFAFLFVLISSVAFVVILLRYLLYNDLPDVEDLEDTEDSFLTIKDLPKSHGLDIIKLTACGRGQMASVGLDRSTCIWSFDGQSFTFSHYILPTPEKSPLLWPIITSAVDDTGTLFAVYCLNGITAVWSIAQHRFIGFTQLDTQDQLCHFSFKLLYAETPSSLRLLIVTIDGYLTELDFQLHNHHTVRLCSSPIASVAVFDSSQKMPLRLVAVSRSGCIHLACRPGADWTSRVIAPFESGLSPNPKQSRVRNIVSAPALNMLVAQKPCEVSLVILESLTVVHAFQIGQVKPGSLRVLHSPRRRCLNCGGLAIHSFSVAYTETETGNCYMHTFTAGEGQNASICLQSSPQHDDSHCEGFAHATEALHWVDSAGVWESCAAQAIIGIRKRSQTTQAASEDSKELGYKNGTTNFLHTLRSRRRIMENAIGARRHDDDDWEAYTLSTSGDFYTTPLHPSSAALDEADPLFVSSAGPICKLGARSVAVGFGNGIKIVALGHERFEELASDIDTAGAGYIGSVSRRGKQNKKHL